MTSGATIGTCSVAIAAVVVFATVLHRAWRAKAADELIEPANGSTIADGSQGPGSVADATATATSSSLLRMAVMTDDAEKVKKLLASGASVDERNNIGGDAALHTAAKWNHAELTILLLDSGADLENRNAAGFTPLHCAASVNAYETARVLLHAGAATDARAADGRVPFEVSVDDRMRELCGGRSLAIFRAIEARDVKTVEAFVNAEASGGRGYDVSERDGNGDSVCTAAVRAAIADRDLGLPLLKAILQGGAGTQASLPSALATLGAGGLGPLHLAAAAREEQLVRLLVDAGEPH